VLPFLLLSPWLVACEDSPTDPMDGLVTEESHAALVLGVDLPSPAILAGSLGGLDEAVTAWQASWELEADEGVLVRDPLYVPFAQALAAELDEDDLESLKSRLDQGLQWVRSLSARRLPQHISAQVASAVAQGASAREALASGDRIGAVEGILRGADAIRMTSLPAVARALVAEAETLLGRVSAGHPYTDQDLERVRRLVRGGRQALAEGDWARATRRAYYATGILEGND
jgi:hypothetical protein